MANYKLILEDDFKDEFTLIAIHCSEEAYKMAFLLNQHLSLQLKRRRTDLDFSKQGLELSFPWFEFEDEYKVESEDKLYFGIELKIRLKNAVRGRRPDRQGIGWWYVRRPVMTFWRRQKIFSVTLPRFFVGYPRLSIDFRLMPIDRSELNYHTIG